MGSKNIIGKQIVKYREKMKITQSELALKCGWDRRRVSNYEIGNREPSYDDIKIIAEALKINAGILIWGDSFLQNEKINYHGKKLNEEMIPVRGIPIIEWNETTNIGKRKMLDKSTDFVYFPADISNPSMYALIIKNDSMVAQTGVQKSFVPGEAVIVDPTNTEVIPNKFVIAIIGESEESIFRKYIEDGGKSYLQALNTAYPLIEITDDVKIIGTVIGSVWRI